MTHKKFRLAPAVSLFAPLFALMALAACNAPSSPGAPGTVSAPNNSSTSGNSSGNGSGTGTGTGSGNGGAVVGESCLSSDPNHLCLAIHFVTYQDSSGTPTANQNQAATILHEMNTLWAQCNIGFQIENYDPVDPTKSGLSYGAQSQNELNSIRNTYGSPSNELLSVTTGPWGTSVNAWTNMPGSGPYGAIMEASIVDYGNGIIYAHEFGHYLGLDHVSNTAQLMNPVIYTTSSTLTSSECQTARDTVAQYWSAMVRK